MSEHEDQKRGIVRLDDKVALVIGAASGIGLASAQLCAEAGAQVMLADVDAEAGRAAAAEINRHGGSAAFTIVNATDEQSVVDVIAATVARFGKLQVLVNSAGAADLHSTPGQAWHDFIDLFLKGPYYACLHSVVEIERAGGGSIVNVASFVALMGAATAQIAYTSSKGGVLAMTREIAVEYARQGIRANALCPGPIQTPLLEELLSDPDRRARRMVHIPMGRLGRAEELAKAALFLASDDASFMTGSALVVDGGITAAYVTPE